MRSSSAKRKITIRPRSYFSRQYQPYRRNFSDISTREARDNASFSVSSYQSTNNFLSGRFSLWEAFRRSDAFNAIQRMFQQVSIQGVSVSLSVSNVIALSTDLAQGSVAFIYAWDRDGILSSQQYDAFQDGGKYENSITTNTENEKVKQNDVYTSLCQNSSGVLNNIAVTSGTRTIGTSIWARSMAEKSMFMSTDLLESDYKFDTHKWDVTAYTRLSGWNPTILMSLQSGYAATVKIQFKFHIVCRGVRILEINNSSPNQPDVPDDEDNNNQGGEELPKHIRTPGTLWQVEWSRSYDEGQQPPNWTQSYIQLSAVSLADYINQKPRELATDNNGGYLPMDVVNPTYASVIDVDTILDPEF